jgi:hypothetical protein
LFQLRKIGRVGLMLRQLYRWSLPCVERDRLRTVSFQFENRNIAGATRKALTYLTKVGMKPGMNSDRFDLTETKRMGRSITGALLAV